MRQSGIHAAIFKIMLNARLQKYNREFSQSNIKSVQVKFYLTIISHIKNYETWDILEILCAARPLTNLVLLEQEIEKILLR
jgi:hypothetical protein